jgi:endonuclease/exonuclease/phosphatase family metal-dependent hydrolase
MINIATYNILSIELANKNYYINTNTKYLQPDFRYQSLQNKLLKKINNNTILCLQEVCYDWLEKLIMFFNSHHYQYQYTQFKCQKGYVGLMTAYPQQYQLDAVKMIHIGHYIEKRIQRISDHLLDKDDVWFKSIIKHNIMLCLKLTYNTDRFSVFNYHMPQSHQCQSLGLLHLISCTQLINKFANNTKYIFAGDFNFQPNSILYEAITKGGQYQKQIKTSTNYDTSQFNCKIATPLIDSYHNQLLYTNYVHTDRDPWYGCIDYIFLSRGWIDKKVDDVINDFSQGPFPDEHESSDHIMIGAQLELK